MKGRLAEGKIRKQKLGKLKTKSEIAKVEI